MKKSKFFKTGTLLLAVLMCICALNITAFASDGKTDDPYVYQYVTHYARSVHRYTEKGKTSNYVPATYLLKDNNGNEFAAYCVDLSVNANKGTMYKRLNLEDVTYFKDEKTAAKVRTIVNNGFWPDDTTATLKALRNATGKSSLTAAEALSGTQLAVWTYGNSGSTELDKYYSKSMAFDSSSSYGQYQTASKVGNNANEHNDANSSGYSSTTASNIAAVRDYLLKLAENQPTSKSSDDVIFNNKHFVSWSKVYASDGSEVNGYNVTVTFGLESTNVSGSLTLTASQNGKALYSSNLSKVPCTNGEYSITFKTNDIKSDITFSLTGEQTLPHSVYFYQAEQVSASQSFVGKGSGSTHVDASAKISMNDVTKAPHDYDYENGTVTKAPTCTEDGEIVYTCKNDSTHTHTETLPATGHTPETDKTKDPTCTETGLTEGSHCKDCGETLAEQEIIEKLEHSFDEGVVTKEPTCTEKGEITYTCQNDSNHTYTEEIPEKKHTVVIDEKVEPTCTETGLTEGKHCEECGETIVEQEVIEKLEHSFDEGVVTKEPTCTEKGEITYTCQNDSNHTYTEEIEEKGHTIVIDEKVEPTYSETGLTEGSHCEECGEIIVEQQVIEKLTKTEESTIKKTETSENNKKSGTAKNNNKTATSTSNSKSAKSPATGNYSVEILAAGIALLCSGSISLKVAKKKNNDAE